MDVEKISYYTNATAFAIVIAMWLVLIWALISRRKRGAAPHASHERRSWIGFALQILSFPLIGVGRFQDASLFAAVRRAIRTQHRLAIIGCFPHCHLRRVRNSRV